VAFRFFYYGSGIFELFDSERGISRQEDKFDFLLLAPRSYFFF